jgi:multiple sugar transport system substrate-binding protein
MSTTAMRRVLPALVIAGLAAAALNGCSGTQASSGAVDKKAPVTLTWWTGQADQPEKLLEKLAKEFHTDHPNVTIKISSGAPTTDDLLQKISAGFVSGDYPDISYAYGSWSGQLASSGRMQDISKQVAAPAVHWDQFPASARQTAAPLDGKVIGFPAVVDDLSVIYNKTLFDKAGLSYPTNDWTWDQFRAAAKKLTNAGAQTYGFGYPVNDVEDNTWRLWPLLWQNGGKILSADSKKAAFDSPAGVKALDTFRSMAVDDKSVYLDQTNEKFEPLFVSGRIGMIMDGPWLLTDLKTGKTNYGVSFLPGTNGKHTTISGPDLWALFDHKDGNRSYWSYELAKWLTDPAQDARYNVALGNLPMRPEAEKSTPQYAALVKDFPGVDVMIANFANVTVARPTVQGYPALSSAVAQAIGKVLQGKASSSDALKKAAQTADAALAKG